MHSHWLTLATGLATSNQNDLFQSAEITLL